MTADADTVRHERRGPFNQLTKSYYDALPKAARAGLHERYGEWLELHAPSLTELDEVFGYHLEQAYRYREQLGERDPELAQRAGQRLGAAGRRAASREDWPAAVTLLSRATALLRADDAERVELLQILGKAMY